LKGKKLGKKKLKNWGKNWGRNTYLPVFFSFTEKLGTSHLFILLIIYLITWRCSQVTGNKIEIKDFNFLD